MRYSLHPTSLLPPRAMLVGALFLGAGAFAATGSQGLAPRVERAAELAARQHIVAPDRLEILSTRFGGAHPDGTSAVRLELAEVEGPNAAGVLRVRFRMVEGDLARGEARATVRGRVYGPALIAKRTLRQGEIIRDSDLELVELDLTRLNGEPLRELDRVEGRVPVRTLSQGRVLTAGLIGPAPVVRRGQPVDLWIEGENMTIRTAGEALRTGAPGELVPAENSATGVRVEGIVQPDGSLRVVRRSGGRRF